MGDSDITFFAQFSDQPEETPEGEREPEPRLLPALDEFTAEDIDF